MVSWPASLYKAWSTLISKFVVSALSNPSYPVIYKTEQSNYATIRWFSAVVVFSLIGFSMYVIQCTMYMDFCLKSNIINSHGSRTVQYSDNQKTRE